MPTHPLVDSRVIAQTFGLRRTLTSPQPKTEQPLLWNAQAYGSVLRDRSGCWRMWYLGPPVYCEYFAASDDGLNWECPELNLVDSSIRPELTGPNAFMSVNQKDEAGRWLVGGKGPEGFCVLDAETTPHPRARDRFTALYLARHQEGERHIAGLYVAYSADGIHWSAGEHNPVISGWMDTSNVFFFDRRLGRYVLYGRPTAHIEHVTRANRLIARAESEDLVHWTPYQTVLDTDEADAPAHDVVDEAALHTGSIENARTRARVWQQITEGSVTDEERPVIRGRNRQWYGLAAFPYCSLYLGLGWMYDVPSGHMWIELCHSYDGIDWRREPFRPPWYPGRPGHWDYPLLCCAASPPVVVDDEVRIYYSARNWTHHGHLIEGASEKRWGVGVLTLPRDRWVGYEAGAGEAELLTQVIERPQTLTLNASTQADGWLRVAVTDTDGTALDGLGLDQAEPITGDSFEHSPIWRDGRSIADVAEERVRLRICARRAKLYAVSF